MASQIVFFLVNFDLKYSIWSSNVFISSRLLPPDHVGSEYPLLILALSLLIIAFCLLILTLCFVKCCSKTYCSNSIIFVSSSRKLDLNVWLRLVIASVRCLWDGCIMGLLHSRDYLKTSF